MSTWTYMNIKGQGDLGSMSLRFNISNFFLFLEIARPIEAQISSVAFMG